MTSKNGKELSKPNGQDAHSLVVLMQETDSNPKPFCGGGELLIGARLRAFRKQKGMSIRSLAKECGISVNTLSLIENDRTSPNVNTLKLLADGLEISIVSFFEEENPEGSIVYQKPEIPRLSVFLMELWKDYEKDYPHLAPSPSW